MLFIPFVFILCALSLALQDFSLVVPWAYNSFIHITAVVFFVCAISVPFPVMLMLSLFVGFLWDAKNACIMADEDVMQAAANLAVSIPKNGTTFGFSIFLFALFGALMQGIRPLFRKRRWTLPLLMTGVCTFLFLVLEYLWINFRRGGFQFKKEILMHITTTSLLSLLLAPFVFLVVRKMATWCRYDTHFDNLNQRRW
jgi:hypothetical protein